jgi:WD40 repeat protein
MSIALTCSCGNTFVADADFGERTVACPVCNALLNLATGQSVPRSTSADDTGILPDGDIMLRINDRDGVLSGDIRIIEEPEDSRETYDIGREHQGLLASAPAAHRFFAAIGVIALPTPARCLAYGAGNQWALAGCGNDVQILYMRVGERTRLFSKHEAPVTCLALAPDGRSALSGDAAGDLFWWDLVSVSVTHRQRAHIGPVRALAISADGAHAVSGGIDGATRLWDLSCGCHAFPIAGPGSRDEVTAVTFATDGQCFLAADAAGRIDIWATESGNHLGTLRAGPEPIACLRCHDGCITACAEVPPSVDRPQHPRVSRWDLLTRMPSPCCDRAVPARYIPGCLALDREGWRLLVAGRRPNVPLHQVPMLADALSEVRDGFRDFFRIRTGQIAANALEVYSLTTGALVHTFPDVSGAIDHISLSPDNTRLLAATDLGNLHVFAMPEV